MIESLVRVDILGNGFDVLCIRALRSIVDSRGSMGNYEIGFDIRDKGIGKYNFILLLVS